MNRRDSKATPKNALPKHGAPKRAATTASAPKKKAKSPFSLFESKILAVLKRDRAKTYASRELMRATGLLDKEQFYAAVKKLNEGGYIEVDSKHIISLPRDTAEVQATLVSLSRGFGFAKPEGGGDDFFIHGSALNGALVGDTILVGKISKDSKGLSGTVIRVLSQPKDTTTGTVQITSYGPELIPDNNIRYNPKLTNLMGAKAGDKVLARLIQDYRGDWNEAEVIRVFGSGESARICSDAIIERYGIPTAFSPEALAQAEEIGKRLVTAEEIRERLDMRDEAVFTIDGADAKDLDDAIFVEKTAEGFTVHVHIADVSHYVQGRTVLDEEAMARGTSVYFADRVVPMLPEAISNGVCSLNAGQDKLCFSALLTLTADGGLKEYRFAKTVVRSKVRGVYSEVNELFDGTASKTIQKKYAPVMEGVTAARELALILRKNSSLRGTMEIDSGESRFILDENGVCIDVQARSTGESQEMIEQLMILANSAAAKISMDAKIPFLYRIHESPQPQRVLELEQLLKALGISCMELVGEAPKTRDFAAILDRARGTGAETLVSQRLLRTMEKAKYSTEPLGHFGLALKDYSHFTSPIRRYPDTSIHRILTALTGGMEKEDMTKRFKSFAERSAIESSSTEVRAVQAERDAEDCYMAEFMKQHIGEEFTGTVSGATKNGVFVRLPNSVEGFVPIDAYTDNHFVFDGLVTHRCSRTDRVITVGTELNIIVASAQVATGRVDFAPNNALPNTHN